MTRPLLLCIVLVGCVSAQDGPEDQRHPLSGEFYLQGVLADGRIDPDWGFGQPDAPPVPDTLAAPRRSLLDLLHDTADAMSGGEDTLRANVVAEVAGFTLCPPCPPGAMCEPCAPDAIVLRQDVDGGRVLGWFVLPSPRSDDGLRVGRRVVATVEVVRHDEWTERRLLGFSGAPR